MAGGALKYRHLNRKSSHRQALLRNLVTSLITHESIKTTWPKAKEAQRLAEKLITLGKKNTNASRAKAESIFFEPLKHLPTLFTTLRQRYLSRPGGYTRVLRIEPLNRNNDQAPSAILELVDGPRDMRFAMTAKTLVREREGDDGIREITARNVAKVTRFRENGEAELEKTVRRLETMKGLGKEEKEAEEDEEIEGREPWEPFGRMKQREREKEDEERPLTERERREKKRTKRDPNTGRRVQAGYR